MKLKAILRSSGITKTKVVNLPHAIWPEGWDINDSLILKEVPEGILVTKENE